MNTCDFSTGGATNGWLVVTGVCCRIVQVYCGVVEAAQRPGHTCLSAFSQCKQWVCETFVRTCTCSHGIDMRCMGKAFLNAVRWYTGEHWRRQLSCKPAFMFIAALAGDMTKEIVPLLLAGHVFHSVAIYDSGSLDMLHMILTGQAGAVL